MSHTLTTASRLMCPHGAPVAISSSNSKVMAGGSPVVRASDSFTISGCPFQIPAVVPIPSPCVRVQWLVPDVSVSVQKDLTLSRSSVGLCLAATGLPQGPVQVQATQGSTRTR